MFTFVPRTPARLTIANLICHPPALEIAAAEVLLAGAYLAAGGISEAETFATQALDVLGPWQHPDAASCLITIALAQAQASGEGDSARIDEGFRLIDGAPLLLPAQKARWKEAETARIRAGGLRDAQDALPVAAA